MDSRHARKSILIPQLVGSVIGILSRLSIPSVLRTLLACDSLAVAVIILGHFPLAPTRSDRSPSEPARTGAQAAASLDDGIHPAVLDHAADESVAAAQEGGGAQHGGLEVERDGLPPVCGRLVDLVGDAEGAHGVRVGAGGRAPPLHGGDVERAVGVGVDILDAAPVGDGHGALAAVARAFILPRALAEEARERGILGVELFVHALAVPVQVGDVRRENAERVIDARKEHEDGDFLVGRARGWGIVAVFVGQDGGPFLLKRPLEVVVGTEAVGYGEGIEGANEEGDDAGEEDPDAWDQKDEGALDDGTGQEKRRRVEVSCENAIDCLSGRVLPTFGWRTGSG